VDTSFVPKDETLLRPKDVLKLSDDLSYRGTYGIRPHGVAQGYVTDCWLMAALSGIAENPERLERIVIPYEKKGIYEVELYAQAKWWKFVIDDFMPTRKGGKYLKYSKPAKGNAIWPMILEKAFAKFHTSYGQLSHGQNYEALYTVTGMPFSRYNVSKLNDDQIFEILQLADQ
jgi:hypothetical protein